MACVRYTALSPLGSVPVSTLSIMGVCASCGTANAGTAKFCSECGAPVAVAGPAGEHRKRVTVVFCDVTGSTALGDSADPEAVRALLARYFRRMKGIVERHGGTVEKFIGDAVMAVFGVPVVHEDDALRAVRAAAEMRDALPELKVQARIGVSSGEVVVGTAERLATGDAVNVAARLEQAAEPGQVLLGAETLRLVREAVDVEAVEPLTLKGKPEPVPAYRLVTVTAETTVARRFATPFVGRNNELEQLRAIHRCVAAERSCRLVTLLGWAGVGKSRLVQEFLSGVDATVVSGRCLSYGEGITYWPVVEVVKQLASSRGVDEALESLLTGGAASTEEIAHGVRRLLESAADERPLVVVWEDLHWAEATFLDLVEHIADRSRGVPILLLCLARSELLELRPGWSSGKPNAATLQLEPFSGDAAGALLDGLAGAPLSPELRARILATAEGNPLFIEETVAMLAETGDADVAVPPTISVLLAARIDQLHAEERGTLECGSIEGEVFHRRAVEALSDEKYGVVAQLAGLVRKELVRPEVAMVAGDDAFGFRHGLIRDATYEALPKARRAALHERFAEWLAVERPGLVELDELLGYHLEQAHRFRRELGVTGDETTRPARQAGGHLGAAGRTALARGDVPAAVSLLSRATTLLPVGDEFRRNLLPELADALSHQGKLDEATKVLAEAFELSAAAGDQHVEAQARLLELSLLAFRRELVPEEDGLPGASVLRDAIVVAREIADDARQRADTQIEAAALRVVARSTFFLGRAAEAEEIAAEAYEIAVRAGDRKLQDDIRSWWLVAKTHGPASVADGIAFCEEARRSQNLQLRTFGALFGAALKAMAGEIDTARAEADQALADLEEFGLVLLRGGGAISRGQIELLVGDMTAAERELRYGWDLLGSLGETGFRASIGALLAQALLHQDRLAEADALLTELGAFVHPDDIEPQMRRCAVRAGILARRGGAEEAVAVAREAVRLAEQTDFVDLRTDAFAALADVLALTGHRDEAAAAVDRALTLHEQKGNVVGAAAAKRLLEELQAST